MRVGRFAFRNKLIRYIRGAWAKEFGAFVIPGDAFFHKESNNKHRNFKRLIIGCNQDGRAIFLYPEVQKRKPVNSHVRIFLQEMAKRGAIVGAVYDVGDAWDVLLGEKRKRRTYAYEKAAKVEPEPHAGADHDDEFIIETRETVEES